MSPGNSFTHATNKLVPRGTVGQALDEVVRMQQQGPRAWQEKATELQGAGVALTCCGRKMAASQRILH